MKSKNTYKNEVVRPEPAVVAGQADERRKSMKEIEMDLVRKVGEGISKVEGEGGWERIGEAIDKGIKVGIGVAIIIAARELIKGFISKEVES